MIGGAWSSSLMLQMIDNQLIVCWEVKKTDLPVQALVVILKNVNKHYGNTNIANTLKLS